MATDDVKRKLTAIFSADVVGYSRLMGEDELSTVQTLTSFKETMTKLIKHYRGRVLDSIGDNLMAEFASVVDAVQCAVEVQQVLSSKNEDLPENRKMLFRIGINLGDVIEEGERIYGDGVNIAARVESLADAGGICISGSAFEQIENKLALGYQYMGEHSVKNIVKPIKVYKVPTEPRAIEVEKRGVVVGWKSMATAGVAVFVVLGVVAVLWRSYWRSPATPPVEVASVEKMAYPLPEKPSIAVLPFANISEDPKQEYFSDGITEEIITGLSKVPRLFVIARNSTFKYKGKPVMVQQVGQELGVRYVLEGSVRRAEEQVRITVQLVDAMTGKHLWAEKYDRDLKHIFALQDEITFKVIAALQVRLTEGEQALIVAGQTDNFEAYEKFLQGVEYFKRLNKDGCLLARKMAEEAIALDPNYPRGYRLLASTHWLDVSLGISKSPKQSLAKAAELYKKVIALDPSEAVAHAMLGFVYTMMRQHEKGIAEVDKAVALNPNAADAQAFLGLVLHFNGRHKEAIEAIKKAIRLNPFPPNWYFSSIAYAYCLSGMYEEAIAACKSSLRIEPGNLFAHRTLAATYALMGREQEARAEAAEVLRISPKFSLEYLEKTMPYKNRADLESVIEAGRKAGLPDKPPLPLPDKPSIAVLPFVNMSGDPEQEYFSDGLTEEIITALSKTPKLFVIARNSSFTYKGKSVWVPTVGKELGVKYVLEGSVRKAGDKVRVTAQLIEAQTNNHIWAERYDRDLKDVFLVQDEITKKITTAMQVKLTEGEQAQVFGKGTQNLNAYLKFLEAHEQLMKFNNDGNRLARQKAEEAIGLDPEYANARALLAFTHILDVWFKWSKSPRESLAHAFDLASKAIALDESCVPAHRILSQIYLLKRQHEKAIEEGELAVSLAPNDANSVNQLGLVLRCGGRAEEAIPMHERAIRLDPMPPPAYLYQLGLCYVLTGNPGKAISICKKALHQNPDDLAVHLALAVAYSLNANEEEARAEAAEVLRIHPKFSVEYAAKTWPYKNEADIETITGALRKAGLK